MFLAKSALICLSAYEMCSITEPLPVAVSLAYGQYKQPQIHLRVSFMCSLQAMADAAEAGGLASPLSRQDSAHDMLGNGSMPTSPSGTVLCGQY